MLQLDAAGGLDSNCIQETDMGPPSSKSSLAQFDCELLIFNGLAVVRRTILGEPGRLRPASLSLGRPAHNLLDGYGVLEADSKIADAVSSSTLTAQRERPGEPKGHARGIRTSKQ